MTLSASRSESTGPVARLLRSRRGGFLPLALCLALLAAGCGGEAGGEESAGRSEPSGVFVNGVELDTETVANVEAQFGVRISEAELDDEELRRIEDEYGVRLANGRFWYDPVSGLWGFEGLFTLGQIPAGIDMGGSLREDAAGGGTDVLVNGRRLHPVELAFLEALLGPIPPGRYFLRADGEYGREGGAAEGNLGVPAAGGRRSILGHSDTGSVIGDGSTVGFIDGETGVTCGPDGGCLFSG